MERETRASARCPLSWALLGLPALSCTAKRSKMRADPALRIVLGIPGAADAAQRLQIDHEIHADLAPRAALGCKTHAPLRAERRASRRAVVAALRAAGVEMHSQIGADVPLRAVLGVSCCPAPLNGARNNARLCAPSWALLGLPALSCTAERSKMRADPALRIVLGPALPN